MIKGTGYRSSIRGLRYNIPPHVTAQLKTLYKKPLYKNGRALSPVRFCNHTGNSDVFAYHRSFKRKSHARWSRL